MLSTGKKGFKWRAVRNTLRVVSPRPLVNISSTIILPGHRIARTARQTDRACRPRDPGRLAGAAYTLTGWITALIWLAITFAPRGASAQIVATIGSDSISVAEFSSRYVPLLESNNRPDALSVRLDFLRTMAEESLLDQYGYEAGISQNPTVLWAGDAARRGYLLTRVAQAFFLDEVAVAPEVVEAEYRYRNTALLLRYLDLPDSLAALDYRRRLGAGERFESLALQAFTPRGLLDSPGQPGWRYPHEMDSLSGRLAYQLAPGELSHPVRVGQRFRVMELLGKEFRPDHGHFERVKRLQGISEELWPWQLAGTAQQNLRQWANDLPYKWRRRGLRKVVRAGVLAGPRPSGLLPQSHALADEQLFSLSAEAYTLDWLQARLALLPPGTFTGITDLTDLQAVCREVLLWEQFAALVGSLPEAEDALEEANARERDLIRQAVSDTILGQLRQAVVVPDDSLRLLLAGNRNRYASPALMSLQEIVVLDATLAAAIRDSIVHGGSDFDGFARRHTLRTWARETNGELGWVRLELYGAAAESLATTALTAPGELVGPMAVDGYLVLARPAAIRESAMPPLGALRQRLRREWFGAARRAQLMSAWLSDQQASAYTITIDTIRLNQLALNAFGQLVLPPKLALDAQLPDSTLEELPAASP